MIMARGLTCMLVLSSAVALPTEYFKNRVVEADLDMCKVQYSDSSISIRISPARDEKSIFYLDDRTGKSVRYWAAENGGAGKIEYRQGEVDGRVEGQQKDILRKFSDVFPFAHVIDKILSQMHHDMLYGECVNLIDDIEDAAPRGFKLEPNWIREFVDEKLDEAFSLTAEFGTYVDKC
ncbi:hypothetical protein FOZ61_010369 [Perkinsus olseni]|uniref:Uncharacterized protein n=1 Tax=Perkinsus olseni TaxID=32597 RepID=A0A7J6KX99_PEROL|nr:hypothetical protein FOZ61_010369 [Perkinsus olseni]KAF4662776.1 hypothetical protein FOL46_005130 [Perkinsus olseni]